MPQRRPHRFRAQPRIEQLEDRDVPAVIAAQDGNGLVTVTLDAASDSATITGTAAGGTSLEVTGTGLASPAIFTGVTGVQVVDAASNAGQSVTFDDDGAGTAIALTGAIGVTGIETVNISTANGALQAGSVTVSGATQIGLNANVTTSGASGQSYGGAVVLGKTAVALNATANGPVTFEQTLDGSASGANSLTVNTAGLTVFTGVVGTTPLGGITTDNAGTTQIKANITTIGAQTYNDPVVLFGNAITVTSTVGANITFNDTLDGSVAGETALLVTSSTGLTSFSGNVGTVAALASLVTSEGSGATQFGPNSAAIRFVITSGAQTYNDAVRLNVSSITFASTSNGNITFNSTLNSTNAVSATAAVNTGGLTTFVGIVGGTVPLAALTTDSAGPANEGTTIRASVTTTSGQTYGDSVTFVPGTNVLSQMLASTVGNVSLNAFGGDSAVPVTVKAGADLILAGNGTFTANGSRLNLQAGAIGSGIYTVSAGRTFRADVQVWQGGDGTGGSATAALDVMTNSPAFRDAGGSNAPKTFVLRQDGAITDATIPALSQFGTSVPANYSVISDDSTLTLNSTTSLAGFGTANLTLASAQVMTLGATINAPAGIVRLRSTSANVNQTGGSISAAGLGVRSGTSTTLTGANAITGTFAALATTSNIQFTNGTAYAVGSIGADPLSLVFTSVSGAAAAAGTIAFSQPGSSPLNLTIAAPVSASTVTATGGIADDTVTVNYSLGATLSNGLVFNGNGGNDTLALSDAGGAAAHTYAAGSSFTRDANPVLTYSSVEIVSVAGGTAADTFNVTPDAIAAITVTGGLPTGTSGDKLNLTLAGATNPSLNATQMGDGFQGTATFGNRAAVSFSQVESVAPQADIQVTATASPPRIAANGTSTITVVVKNAGPDAATGIAFDQLFPANATFTWTAVATAGSSVAATSGSGDIHTTMDLILNGTVTFTITATATAALGNLTTTATASSGSAAFDSNTANNSATVTVIVEATALTAVGAGAGSGPHVKVYNADGSQRFSFFAYDPSFTAGVTVATGDVNDDGVEDIVTGAATTASHVKVFNGATGAEIASFFAFPGFAGGVNVAVAGGDVVVGAGSGGGPVFAGYDIGVGGVTQTFSLLAFDPSFRGGVQIAGSDNLIAVAAGPGGSSHVKVFNATTQVQVSSFYALPLSISTGVNLAMGKSGSVETVIVGAGKGATPAVVTAEATTGNIVGSVLAFPSSFTGGVRVASTTTPAGQAGTVFAAGPGGSPRVRILGPNGAPALDFFAFDPSFTGGIYVG